MRRAAERRTTNHGTFESPSPQMITLLVLRCFGGICFRERSGAFGDPHFNAL
jgi:hypothetical protein